MLDQAQQLVARRIFQGADERLMERVEKAGLLTLQTVSSDFDQNVRHVALPACFGPKEGADVSRRHNSDIPDPAFGSGEARMILDACASMAVAQKSLHLPAFRRLDQEHGAPPHALRLLSPDPRPHCHARERPRFGA